MEVEAEDPEKLLNTLLGELDTLAMGLDKGCMGNVRPLSSDLNTPRTDTYRFSMANLEDTQDVDLDAILGELCALESQYDDAIATTNNKQVGDGAHRRSPSDGTQVGSSVRTDSPDNDSAFSDSVSLLSSESSASSGRNDTHSQLEGNGKAEKIRLALQKMKEAAVKKLFIKAFCCDGSAKSLLVDETMTVAYVTKLLADKNHQAMDPRWALLEYLPQLHMERVYEDQEMLVDNLMLWSRDSKNRLLFVERPERTLLFERPHAFIGPTDLGQETQMDDFARSAMLEEFFAGSGVPGVEGPLHLKADSRKGWKRYHCILRASGLYYWPKEKAKCSSKDLVCLATFDSNQVYYGVGWRKKFKSPTEFCFGLKHPCLQEPKSTKYIKLLCADDEETMHRWVTAIRIAKHGRQLLDNYRAVVEDCQHDTLTTSTLRGSITSRALSVLDSGSESGSSGCDVAFESDFPSGTIKRKPPKLPLTATTRQLKEIAIGAAERALERVPSLEQRLLRVPSVDLPPPPPELLRDDPETEAEMLPLPLPLPPRLAPPSTAFLADLQRVMKRKWQVAQKCKLDQTTTPHEVLGFRDPPDYRETNVSNWVAEHYGCGQGLYENVYPPGTEPPPPPMPSTVNPVAGKKRPPPPPPRAHTTVLTTRATLC